MMQKLIQIRRMIQSDIDTVVSIYTDIFEAPYISFGELASGLAQSPTQISPQASELFRQELLDDIDNLQTGLFVATLKSEVIGFAVATLEKTKIGHVECWLQDLGTSPKFRRKGVAKALVQYILQWGKQQGAEYFLLESGIHNKTAHKLFQNIGFLPLATVFWHKT